jgi:hypothetical protein
VCDETLGNSAWRCGGRHKKGKALLSRRHVAIGGLRFIGKESNRIDEAEQGLTSSPVVGAVIDYRDPRRAE